MQKPRVTSQGMEWSQSQKPSEPTSQSLLPAHIPHGRETVGSGIKADPDGTTETKKIESTDRTGGGGRGTELALTELLNPESKKPHFFGYYMKRTEEGNA